MVQAAQPRHTKHFATRRRIGGCNATCRRSFLQPEMCPVVVIVGNVFGDQPFEMAFVERDNLVEQISATATDKSLSDTVMDS